MMMMFFVNDVIVKLPQMYEIVELAYAVSCLSVQLKGLTLDTRLLIVLCVLYQQTVWISHQLESWKKN